MKIRRVSGLLLGLLVLGCATVDTASLDDARGAVEAIAADPSIDADTSLHMREARRLLEVAQQVVDDRGAQEIVDHNARLARTHAEIAQDRARERTARKDAGDAAPSTSETTQ